MSDAARSRLDAYDRLIDREFRRWAARLPPALCRVAAALPHTIGMSRRPRWQSWRGVFRSPVMRALPFVVGEGLPHVGAVQLQAVGAAHVLFNFLVFFDDRLNDGQAVLTREANLIRRGIEAEVQAQVAAVVGSRADFWRRFHRAYRQYADVHAREPALWAGAAGRYDHRAYARDAAAKLAITKLPALALAMTNGAPARDIARLSRLIDHCVIVLQYTDDVADWAEDFASDRWTYFVLRHLSAAEARRKIPVTLAALRTRVAAAGVDDEFLQHASAHVAAGLALVDGRAMPTLRHWLYAQHDELRAAATVRRRAREHARRQFVRALEHCWRS